MTPQEKKMLANILQLRFEFEVEARTGFGRADTKQGAITRFVIFYRKQPTFRPTKNFNWNNYVKLLEVRLSDLQYENEEHMLEALFIQMQGEHWSPQGDARPLIEHRGLRHTSMSVGDLVYNETSGRVWEVDICGFKHIH